MGTCWVHVTHANSNQTLRLVQLHFYFVSHNKQLLSNGSLTDLTSVLWCVNRKNTLIIHLIKTLPFSPSWISVDPCCCLILLLCVGAVPFHHQHHYSCLNNPLERTVCKRSRITFTSRDEWLWIALLFLMLKFELMSTGISHLAPYFPRGLFAEADEGTGLTII